MMYGGPVKCMEDPSNVGPGIGKTGTGQWEGYNNGQWNIAVNTG